MPNFRTSADLVVRAAGMLNFLRPGEDLEDRHKQTMLDTWAEVNALLQQDGISTWPDDEIPVVVFRHCARILALEVAPEFGALPPLLQSLGVQNAHSGINQAKSDLRSILMEPARFEPLEVKTI